ncbi:MAG: TraR/DksA C4-type zinc finger protein [Chloroflexota bacterium]
MADLSRLNQRLCEEEARLAAELQRLEGTAGDAGERRSGSPFGKKEEEASQAFDMERRLALEKSLMGLLAEVRHALDKLQKGTYGRCDACGKSIGEERLEVFPQANLCLKCKAKHARGKAR